MPTHTASSFRSCRSVSTSCLLLRIFLMLCVKNTMSGEPMQQHCISPPTPGRFSSGSSSRDLPWGSSDVGNGAKRDRDEGQIQHHAPYQQRIHSGGDSSLYHHHQAPHISHTMVSPQDQLPESSSKRARSSTYEVPRTVPPSILTATGSLVGGMPSTGLGDRRSQLTAPLVFPLRRQLSSGALDSHIGGSDAMDLETNDQSRQRSMSF